MKIRNNIFEYYSKPENNFTKALINVLEASFDKGDKIVITKFLKLINPSLSHSNDIEFSVQKSMDGGTYDSKLSSRKKGYYIAIETKIKERSLRMDQLRRHCRNLKHQKDYKRKFLVTITPDLEKGYFTSNLSSVKCDSKHISWKKIFENFQEIKMQNSISETAAFLIDQFNDFLDNEFLATKSAGGIAKAVKGHFPKEYENRIFNGRVKIWNSPRLYLGMRGGDKVMVIYKSESREIIGEVVIKDIEENMNPREWGRYQYIFSNVVKYPKPIPRKKLEKMFNDKFFSGRSSFRYITIEELKSIRKEARGFEK